MKPHLHTALALALMTALLLQSGCSKSSPSPAPGAGPTPRMSPDQVIKAVMTALKDNDHPHADSGIATTFAFASPQNKQATGPLERFLPMVKSPMYAPMLNFRDIKYGPLIIADNEARQLIRVTAPDSSTASYLFILHKQVEGDYKDCWMTDGVMRLREGPPTTRPEPTPRSEEPGNAPI